MEFVKAARGSARQKELHEKHKQPEENITRRHKGTKGRQSEEKSTWIYRMNRITENTLHVDPQITPINAD